MKIVDVKVSLLPPRGKGWLNETLIANPMSIYPDYKMQRSSWRAPFQHVLVKIYTSDKQEGISVAWGGIASKILIEEHLKRFVIGKDPFDLEVIWDQLYRSSIPYGRKGIAIMAISGIDNSLWDLLGKILGVPVYRLLGGATKDKVEVYATGPKAHIYKQLGFRRVKIPMPYGPADGREGMMKNMELVREVRKEIGYDVQMAIDCYMGWDVEYTLKMCEILEEYEVEWVEEPLVPDDIDGYKRLKASMSRPMIAAGEHEFTRYGFREIIESKAVDIIQPDILWSGGISEVKKISALASARNIKVIPHNGGIFSYHFVMSNQNSPMAEYVFLSPNGDTLQPTFKGIEGEPLPERGFIKVEEKPGFGIEFSGE
ncbi:MAG: enolase C-terminal domain-like protein [Candidatus Bathyarchaeia archaeon]